MAEIGAPDHIVGARAVAPFAFGPVALTAGYLGFTLLPVTVAWVLVPSGGPFWPELATGLGLVGYAMLLAQFVLTGRMRLIGGRIGIDLVMRFHQLAARSLTLFIVLHPFLYAARRAVAHPEASLYELAALFAAPALATGVIGWALLIALVAASVWRPRLPFTYEFWRVTHGLGAFTIALLVLHHALTIGGLSGGGSPLGLVWIALATLAAITMLSVYVLRPLALRRRPWRVVEVTRVGPGRWTLAVESVHGGMRFRAGEFAWLKIGPTPFTVREHPMSFASAPGDGRRIEFLIREAGDFTRKIGATALGTLVWIDGPHGAFVLPGAGEAEARRIVLLAGGVGLAPILSILRDAAARGDPRSFHLIFGNRTEDQIVLRTGIEALKSNFDLRVDYVLSEPPAGWTGAIGQLDAATVGRLLAGTRAAEGLYYLCGPPVMVAAAERALAGLGIPPGRVIAERFEYD